MKRIWKTKGGQRLKIRDMETSHIINCVRILHRHNMARLAQMYSIADMLHGEEASLCLERDICSIEEDGFGENDLAEQYLFAFQEELERRKEKT